MGETAVVVIDMQMGMFTLDEPLYRADELLATVQDLAGRARAAGVPVIYVRHAGGEGHPLEEGTEGFEIHGAVAPAAGEAVIDKRTADAFADSDLDAELTRLGVDTLVVAGLQTEYCIDTTCRRASILGYQVILVSDAHSTWDTEVLSADLIIAHHNDLLGALFVELRTSKELEL